MIFPLNSSTPISARYDNPASPYRRKHHAGRRQQGRETIIIANANFNIATADCDSGSAPK
jgi:hypothetical protein